MSRTARPLVLGIAVLAAWLRRDLVVRAIRTIDRRSGIASSVGTGLYARFAARFTRPLRRHVVDEAAEHLALDGSGLVIDIGCGPGDLVVDLAQRLPDARVVGVDPSPDMLRHARATAGASSVGDRVSFVDGGAERLPFADGSVDIAVSTLSAHHWPDASAAFAELARVLRPGGIARIHDIRFAAYGPGEIDDLGRRAGLPAGAPTHEVCDLRLGPVRPLIVYSLTGGPLGPDR